LEISFYDDQFYSWSVAKSLSRSATTGNIFARTYMFWPEAADQVKKGESVEVS
jgi:hypothetical protein